MVSCQLCRSTSSSQYLFTACMHAICLQCCYRETDFTASKIKCCGIHTTLDRAAMNQVVKTKQINNVRVSQTQKDNSIFIKESISQQISPRKQYELPNQASWDQKNRFIIQKRLASSLKNNLPINELKFPQSPKQAKNSKNYEAKNNQKNQSVEQKYPNQLENILMLQIEKVKKEFDIQHKILRKKEDSLLSELMAAYQDQIKNIQRPIKTSFKLNDLDTSMQQLKNNKKQQALKQSQQSEKLKENKVQQIPQKSSHYDNVIRKLQINQQRMSERFQRHLKSLS